MKQLVLVGAGHTHALLLKAFGKDKLSNVEVILVSPNRFSPYSGMIPAWIGGTYRWEECCIDFAKLCKNAGAQLRLDAVSALHPGRNELTLQSGERLGFDILSLDVGATVTSLSGAGPTVLPMRPISELPSHWNTLTDRIVSLPSNTPIGIVTVGGGAAGVEVSLAASHFLRKLAPHVNFTFALATHSEDILPGMAATAKRRLHRHFDIQQIALITNFKADRLAGEHLFSIDYRKVKADVVLLASGAQPHAWLRESGLHLDAQGFVAVDAMLRSRSHPNIFASGDCAGWETPLPKAGVYAVRMSPVLVQNILASTKGLPLQTYRPQNRYLSLIGTGDENAIAAWGAYAWEGRIMWRLKQMIDTRFVAKANH